MGQSLVKISLITVFLFHCFLSINIAHAIDNEQLPMVVKVIKAFKDDNRVLLSEMISYPLLRQPPLSPINNKADFLKRYDDIFDQYVLNVITESNVYTDWDNIGWQGIILNHGMVALDPEGNIIDINYHSPREQALVVALQNQNDTKGRSSLERSSQGVNTLSDALVEVMTPATYIRVDRLNKDQNVLRYSAWSSGRKVTEAPDIVLNNGQLFSNNGRNQKYVFNNGTYQYRLNVSSSGEGVVPTGTLEVFKDGEFLKREVATKVTNY